MPDLTTARDKFAALAAGLESTWRAEADAETRTGNLHLYGAIGGYWGGIDAAEMVPAIRDLDVDTLNVYVNSPGGNVYDGVAIRNALRGHKARVIVTVDGLAASAASFIACAGDEVIMAENSELMIHEAWGLAIGNADDMLAAADDLDRISGNIADMYAAKAGGDAADWRALMKAETWYSAAEAVAAGLADRLDSDTDDEPEADADVAALFDLSMYAHAGRAAASAPVPVAAMASHRKERPMPETLTRADLDAALTEQAEAQTRLIEARMASFTAPAAAAGPTWPTFGHFLKALVSGDESAMAFYETHAAYDGSTTADDKQPNTWVRDAIHLIRKTRKVMGDFSTQPLPADGMTLEYLQLASNSIAVAKQENEGDALVKGKITLKSASTPVETYGGWTELSRQQIDRGSEAYLTTANTAMTLEYARATEEVVRDLLREIIATKIATAALSIDADATAYEWLDLIVDAAGLFDDLSFNLDGGLVSKDVFKRLIRLEDTNGNSLMRVWGTGMNQVGELDLREIKGDLASVQFKILPGAEANTIEFHDRLGITTWESPGAPFRLQDTNTVNLTESVSQYGYLAAASQFPDAIQAVKVNPAV